MDWNSEAVASSAEMLDEWYGDFALCEIGPLKEHQGMGYMQE